MVARILGARRGGVGVAAMIAALAVILSGCGSGSSNAPSSGTSGKQAGQVVIGAVFPLTGVNAEAGRDSLRGVQVAVNDINSHGGIKSMGGAKIKLITADSTSDPGQAAAAAQHMLSGSQKPLALVGAYASALTLPVARVAEQAHVPLLTTGFTDDLVTQGYKYIFQIPPRASAVGKAQMDYALQIAKAQGHPIHRVAIVYENDAFGAGTAAGLKAATTAHGLQLALYDGYDKTIADATPLASKIMAAHADVVFPVSYLSDGILLVRALHSSGNKAPLVGGVGGFVTSDFVKAVHSLANGIFSVDTSSPDFYGALGAKYQKHYGVFMPQGAHDNAAGVYCIVQALDMKPTHSSSALASTLHSGTFTMGAAGTMPGGKVKFAANGANAVIKPLMVEWQHQQLVSVWPKVFAKHTPIWP